MKSNPPTLESNLALESIFAERSRERVLLVDRELVAEGISDERVLRALRRVPRHRFVPVAFRDDAYQNHPLPIGFGQTISQPYIVALMTEAIRIGPKERCLEIGTGSGYQAAVLAELCEEVYSIEYLPPLAEVARKTLESLGYELNLRTGDGYHGWPEAAPFDTIVVTAAPAYVPEPLLRQLAIHGRLVIPVGGEHSVQRLELWSRKRAGNQRDAFTRQILGDVRFVPFVGEAERRELTP